MAAAAKPPSASCSQHRSSSSSSSTATTRTRCRTRNRWPWPVVVDLLVVIGSLVGVVGVDGKEVRDLHIAGIFPMNGTSGWIGGPGCLPAAMMALDDVNNRSDLLPGYRLNVRWNDSECEPGLGASVMYDLLYNPPMKLMLLCGCSIVCTTVGEAAKMWNLVVLSYGSSSPALSDRLRFPTFFRTHPSATVHNPTRIRLFQKYGWTRIAILQQAEEVFTSTVEDLEARCKENGIEIATRQSFLTSPGDAVRNLQRQDARIIVGLFYVAAARHVMCEAYHQKMFGKQFVWFLIGWYEDNWYTVPDDIKCTQEQMRDVVEGHITTEALMLNQDSKPTISGMSSQEFVQRLDRELAKKGVTTSKPEGYQEAPLAYDAIWAIALALNKTMHRLDEDGLSLENFTYTNDYIARQIYSAMNSTQFLGVSGSVAFSEKGDRIAWTQIEQMIDGKYHKLGFYDTQTDNLTWFNVEKWTGGKPPRDRTIVVPVLRTVSMPLFIAMSIISCIGIATAIAMLAFNVAFRQRRFIECSHPACNNITMLGTVLCLLSVILLGIDGQFVSVDQYPTLCQARAWMLSIGFSLAFGSMFSKIWRVHRITTKTKTEVKKIHTWKLYVMLATMLSIDIVVLVSWQIMDPLQRTIEAFPQENPLNTAEDIKLEPHLEHCESQNTTVWLGVMYGYKGLLLIFGIFLAYETRSVKVKQINDSRYVGMSIYNVVVLCMITAPVSMVISSQQDASFAFIALAIIFCCFLSMALIFIPKVSELMRHPRERVESRHLTDTCPSKEEEERHQKLVAENEELKQLIVEQEEKIRLLHHKLKEKGALQTKSSLDTPKGQGSRVTAPSGTLVSPGGDSLAPGAEESSKTDGTGNVVRGQERNTIVVDLNSDSAIGLGTSVPRSPRTSPSDFELSESYL